MRMGPSCPAVGQREKLQPNLIVLEIVAGEQGVMAISMGVLPGNKISNLFVAGAAT